MIKVNKLENIEIGIVIPVFKHSVYINEAILSALKQNIDCGFAIVIVNDGCPNNETDNICCIYANAYPKKIFYIRKFNGGLSSARNVGIDFLLNKFQSIKALYLLDADNRIMPNTLQNAWNVLKNTSENVGWVYPDIDMFGIDHNLSTRGEFSILKIMYHNYCDAGSMIKRKVFDAGIRYDENMVLGYEDWEFWLQAIEKGFIGVYVPDMGFEYRKRPESMLANSMRDDTQIKGYIRRKHEKLFLIKNLLKLEAKEASRYAISMDDENVYYCVDPNVLKKYKNTQHIKQFLQAFFFPYTCHVPPISVFTDAKSFAVINNLGILHWLFWKADNILNNIDSIVAVRILTSLNDKLTIDIKYNLKNSDYIKYADLIFVKNRLLFNEVSKNSQALFEDRFYIEINFISISIPNYTEKTDDFAVKMFKSFFQNIRLEYFRVHKDFLLINEDWKTKGYTKHNDLNTIPKKLSKFNSIYPLLNTKKKIGFILPSSSYVEIEKIAHGMARILKQKGYSTHLFILNTLSYPIFNALKDSYDTISFIYDDSKKFKDNFVKNYDNSKKKRQALELLSTMDFVINQHCTDALEIMGELKRFGVITINCLHFIEGYNNHLYEDYPHNDVAYEYGFDYYVVTSKKLKNTIHGLGVPKEKIVNITYAPSYEIPYAKLIQMQEKKLLQKNKRLRVLYIESLCYQKDMHILDSIYKAAQSTNIEWKIVRKDISKFTNDELISLYIWADCIILPDFNEIFSIRLLEIMRLGVIPLCTDNGAICEIIKHEYNGFIFKNQGYSLVFKFSQTLIKLQKNLDWRKSLQQTVMKMLESYSWDKSVKKLETTILKEL